MPVCTEAGACTDCVLRPVYCCQMKNHQIWSWCNFLTHWGGLVSIIFIRCLSRAVPHLLCLLCCRIKKKQKLLKHLPEPYLKLKMTQCAIKHASTIAGGEWNQFSNLNTAQWSHLQHSPTKRHLLVSVIFQCKSNFLIMFFIIAMSQSGRRGKIEWGGYRAKRGNMVIGLIVTTYRKV